MDSGASRTLITRADVLKRKYVVEDVRGGPVVQYANSDISAPITHSVHMGEWMKAYVVDNLGETLISVRDYTREGNRVLFDSGGGKITNSWSDQEMIIHLVDDQHYVKLDDVEHFPMCKPATPKTVSIKGYRVRLSVQKKIVDLHERMGHVNPSVMIKALQDVDPTWKDCGVTAKEVQEHYADSGNQCLCMLSKRNRPKKMPRKQPKSEVIGEVISGDPIFKIYPESCEGDLGAFIFSDECTGFLHIFTGRYKSQFMDCFKAVVLWYKSYNHVVKYLQTDSENVVLSAELTEWCLEKGCHGIRSIPYEHWQNAVERDVQSFNKGVSALMNGQRYLSADYWHLAAVHWGDLRNNTPNVNTGNSTPWKLVTGEALSLEEKYLFKFGEVVCVPVVGPDKIWRFDAKNDIGIYVGQPKGVINGGKVLMPWNGKIYTRGSLRKVVAGIDDLERWIGVRQEMMSGKLSVGQMNHLIGEEIHKVKDQLLKQLAGRKPDEKQQMHIKIVEEKDRYAPEIERRYPKRKVTKPDRLYKSSEIVSPNEAIIEGFNAILDDGLESSDLYDKSNLWELSAGEQFMAKKARVRTERNPTVTKALQSPNRQGWLDALLKEWDLLRGGGGKVPALGPGIPSESRPTHPRQKVVRSTFQMLEKLTGEGLHDKFKARGCVSGDMLKGIIEDTFSPTVNSVTSALLQNIAMIDEMVEMLVDIVGAFLYPVYPDDKDPLYVTIEDNVADALGEPRGSWYRVLKYIYGLPDAGKAFYEMYRGHLVANGYEPTVSDPCLFYKWNGARVIYLWIHVDDTYVCATDRNMLDELVEVLKSKFELTITDKVESYVGIKTELLVNGDRKLSQPKLLKKMFTTWGINERNKDLYPTKQSVSEKLIKESRKIDRIKYLTLLGGLIYMLKTRPDIGFAVSLAATRSTEPDSIDWLKLMTILHYLYNTQTYGLVMKKLPKGSVLELNCDVDASYLTHKDSKSHTAFSLGFGRQGKFYSKSVKQSTVSTSSTHAEGIAMFTLIKLIIYIETLCKEIGRPLKLPINVLEDNDALIILMNKDEGVSNRTRHFLMLIHYCREQVQSGLISVSHVDSEENIADIGSKAIYGQDFVFKRQGLMGLQEGEQAVQPVKRVKGVTFTDD